MLFVFVHFHFGPKMFVQYISFRATKAKPRILLKPSLTGSWDYISVSAKLSNNFTPMITMLKNITFEQDQPTKHDFWSKLANISFLSLSNLRSMKKKMFITIYHSIKFCNSWARYQLFDQLNFVLDCISVNLAFKQQSICPWWWNKRNAFIASLILGGT